VTCAPSTLQTDHEHSHEAGDEEADDEDDVDPRNIIRRRNAGSKLPEINLLHVRAAATPLTGNERCTGCDSDFSAI
jgi:hypothetical protein